MRRLAILLFFVAATAMAEPSRLVILPFENSTNRAELDRLRWGVPDFLIVSFGDHPNDVEIVERQKLEALMSEQSLKWENVLEAKSFSKVGQLAQARYILRGSILPVGKKPQLQALLFDTETTRLLKSFEAAKSAASVEAQCDSIAAQVATFLRSAPRPAGVQAPSDSDPVTRQQFASGLAYFHQGQYAKAIPEFMKVLSTNPRHADAKYWLWQSYQSAGLRDQAAIEAKDFAEKFPNDLRVAETWQRRSR
jgi:tetratricopeptide (TPR) repeat protein